MRRQFAVPVRWPVRVAKVIGVIDLLGAVVAALGLLAAVVMATMDRDDSLNALAILGSGATAGTYAVAGLLLVATKTRLRLGLTIGAAGVAGPVLLILGMRLADTPWPELIPYWSGAAIYLGMHGWPLALWWRELAPAELTDEAMLSQ